MDEILTNLFLGDQQDGLNAPAEMLVLNVLEGAPAEMRGTRLRLPILRDGVAQRDALEEAARFLDAQLRAGRRVLVHCGAGAERSPLTVAYFLVSWRGLNWDQAYLLLQQKRPVVQDRRHWLPEAL